MKKFLIPIFLLLVFCFLLPIKTDVIFAENISIKIIVNECKIYQEADTSSAVYQTKIPHKTVLDATDYNEEFYFVTYSSQTGYILKTCAMKSENSSPEKKLVFNAVTTQDCSIYKLENNNIVNTYFDKLAKGTEVKLVDGFDKNNKYTLVSFYDENSNIVSYYLETANLKTYGFPKSLFVAASLIITCTSIIFILFGTKIKAKSKY